MQTPAVHPFAHMNASNARLTEAAGPASERRAAFYRFFTEAPEATPTRSAPRSRAALTEAPGRLDETLPAPLDPDPAATPRTSLPRSRPIDTEAADPVPPNDSPATPGSRVPHFSDVPDAAKHPAGPYVQAPEEYGGEWWLVNPFVGTEPWITATIEVTEGAGPADLPADFTRIFGDTPARRSGESYGEFRSRSVNWKQNLEYFQGSGVPEGFDPEEIALASSTFEAWGMGEPQFYEGRYGWRVRFPDSAIPEFEFNVQAAITVPHIVIARYQVRQIREGTPPAEFHPFLPEGLRKDRLPAIEPPDDDGHSIGPVDDSDHVVS